MHTMFIKVPDREEAPNTFCCCYSVAQSCPTLRPHGLHHARFPCLSPSPRAYSNSCHGVGDAIQPSHSLLSPSSPALNLSQHHGLFQWSVSQSNGASTSASVLPMSIQGWFPLGLTDLISVILDMLFNFSDPWFSYLYKGKLLTISQYCCKLFETIYASASLGPESLCCFPNASENLKLKGDVLSCQLLLLTL